MATLFTKIINKELPGRFVYEDDECVAFLTIEPLSPGHTLVVPRQEIDHWLDLGPELLNHLMHVAQRVGQALEQVYRPARVGVIIAGLEVPHVHIHLMPINKVQDLDFARVDRNPDPADLDESARLIAAALEL
jgi:histidine triad (HIT) family protein